MTPNTMKARTIGFVGQEISWAGVCPWTNEDCFGTMVGALLMPTSGDAYGVLEIFRDVAVNDVAFSNELIAISSREGVRFGRRSGTDVLQIDRFGPPFGAGAHGVVPHSSGFLAPLGSDGLLMMRRDGDSSRLETAHVVGESFCFSKLISLGHGPDGELFVAAGRTSGLAVIRIQHGRIATTLAGRKSGGVDFVDVCSLGSAEAPRAVVALDRGGRLLWMRDVQDPAPPVLLDLGCLIGTAYSLFCIAGHIIVLTSKELATIPNLASRFLAGELLNRPTDGMSLGIEAEDAFLMQDQTICVLGEDGAVSLRAADLVAGVAVGHGELRSRPTLPVTYAPTIVSQQWSPLDSSFGAVVAA